MQQTKAWEISELPSLVIQQCLKENTLVCGCPQIIPKELVAMGSAFGVPISFTVIHRLLLGGYLVPVTGRCPGPSSALSHIYGFLSRSVPGTFHFAACKEHLQHPARLREGFGHCRTCMYNTTVLFVASHPKSCTTTASTQQPRGRA